MAKARLTSRNKPKLFKDPKKTLRDVKKSTQSAILASVAKDLASLGYDTKKTPKYVVATERKLRERGIIDLKPRFARSSKAKRKKDGGWYLIIPIAKRARDFKPNTVYKQARSLSKDLEAGMSRNLIVKGLADGLNKNQSDNAMQYKAKSDSLYATKNKTGKRTTYVAFRTVSNKSAPSSWIVGRSKLKNKDVSKSFQRDIDNMLKWKVRNMLKR